MLQGTGAKKNQGEAPMSDHAEVETDAERQAFGRVSRRLTWLLFLMLVVNFLDRSNIGFAALTMNRALGLDGKTFGLALSVFSIVYLLCEIPSNLALERFGARVWIARIMITWGLASAACAFAMGATSLILLRGVVGAAEAGFVPGLVFYLTTWYPQFRRARAQASFFIAQPIAVAFGSILSGAILGMDGVLGVAGWRWLLVLEGLPAVLLGVFCLYYLTDRPADSAWLSPADQRTIEQAVRRDAETREQIGGHLGSRWRLLGSRNLLLISCSYALVVGTYASGAYWLPQIVRAMTSPGTPFWQTGLLTAIPPLATAATLPFWSARSDRARERYWHVILPVAAGAGGWFLAAGSSSAPMQLLGLTIGGVCATAVWSLYFAMPSAVLPRHAHAIGIAFMNSIGMCGSALTPFVIGVLRDQTGSFAWPMAFVGCTLLGSCLLMLFVPRALLTGDGQAAARPARAAAE